VDFPVPRGPKRKNECLGDCRILLNIPHKSLSHNPLRHPNEVIHPGPDQGNPIEVK
jgi:hypothetical protein